MNKEVTQVALSAARMIPDAQVRHTLLPYLVGFAVCTLHTVQNDENPEQATAQARFNELVRPELARQLSVINEDMVFDINTAIQAAQAFYRLRYGIVNQCSTLYAGGVEFDVFAIMFGFSGLLPVPVYECMKLHSPQAAHVYTSLVLLARKLFCEKE